MSTDIPALDYRLAFDLAPIGLVLSRNRSIVDCNARLCDETFWCHVTGRALNRAAPHEAGIWTFLDLSSRRRVKAELTPREREVAAFLMDGLTSKEISSCPKA